MAINYPLSLPCPQTALVTPLERAQYSDPSRPREARALSLDRLGIVRATWPPLSPAQAEIFEEWWRTTIYEGGAWFNATWPLPQGRVPAVFHFIEQPRWRFVPGGRWRIEAVLEQRGRGLPVNEPEPVAAPTAWDTTNEDGTVTFSEANYVAEMEAPTSGVVSETARSISGSYYGEIVVLAPTGGFIANNAAASAAIYHVSPGLVWVEGVGMALDEAGGVIDPQLGGIGSVGALEENDVIMLAIEIDTGKGYLGLNGSWLLGCDPETGTELGTFLDPTTLQFYLSYGVLESESDAKARIRTSAGQFSYPVPTGFQQWGP